MTTKEQERKALAQISSIIEKLGPDSYIGIAFEGCIQDAVENIENDWACSWKQRADSLDSKNAALEVEACDLRIALKKEKARADEAEKRYNELKARQLKPDDLDDFEQMLNDSIYECEQVIKREAAAIVDMADTPQDVAFLDAVTSHRRAKQKRKYLADILARVKQAQGQN